MSFARALIFGFLLSMPWSVLVADGLRPHDFVRVAQISVLLTCSVAFAARLIRPLPAAPTLAGLAVALLTLPSLMYAASPWAAAREVALYLGLAAAVATVAMARDRDLSAMPAISAAATAFYGVLVLMLVLLVQIGGQPIELAELFVGYDNYRFLNHVQTLALPLAAIAIGTAGRRTAVLGWSASILGFAFLTFTAGRATFVAIAIGCVAAGALFGRRALPLIRYLAVAVCAGVLLFLALFVAPSLTGPSQSLGTQYSELGSDHSRVFLWTLALEYIGESPWHGIGPMHYAQRLNVKAAHPHNIYLQIAAEFGVFMLLALVAMGGWGLWRIVRAVRRCSDPAQARIGVGIFIACLGAAVDGMFSGNFVMPASQMWIVFAVGWAIAWTRKNDPLIVQHLTVANSRAIGMVFAGVMLASQSWLFWNTWLEAKDLNARMEQVRKLTPENKRTNPRFWSHGWF